MRSLTLLSPRTSLPSPLARSWVPSLASVAFSLSLVVSSAHVAHAQVGSDKVSAEALFEEGRRLMAQNKAADACPKFAESQRLDPSPATLLNLGSCYEKLGRIASAWAVYKQAASAANATKRADYLASAQKHSASLESRLARVTINAAAPVDGMEIKRDGVMVGRGEWGVAIPVDPGSHVLEAIAPKKLPYKSTFDVKEEGTLQNLTVPALDDAPEAAPTTVTPPPTTTTTASPSTTGPTSTSPMGTTEGEGAHRGNSQRWVATVVGGVGVIGVVVGSVMATRAKSKYDESLKSCPNDKNLCTADGVSQRDDARAAGTQATVALGVGAVAMVAGVVLWFTAPKSNVATTGPATARVRFEVAPTLGGGSAMVRGQW
jgi:hypothetical protein